MTDNNIRGILTSCLTNEKIDIDLEYEIETVNNWLESGAMYLKLIVRLFPPPEDLVGYIGFSIDDSDLKQIAEKGWTACNYNESEIPSEESYITKITRHYKLFFPPEEMKRIFKKENLIE